MTLTRYLMREAPIRKTDKKQIKNKKKPIFKFQKTILVFSCF